MTAAAPFRNRYVLLCGVLFAVGVTLAEEPTLHVDDLSFGQVAMVAVRIGLLWVGSGVTWAIAAKLAEERRPFLILPGALVAAWLIGIVGNIIWRVALPPDEGANSPILSGIPFLDLFAYLLWCNIFYGGLYTAGYLLARRAGRQRTALAEQRRIRSEADGALREAQLVSLRGQLQPDLLIEALAVLQDRYAIDRGRGDELFDRLVGFLRAAMPGVRSGCSTLRAELDVLASYVTLRAILPGPELLSFGALAQPPEGTSFPPLVLLPSIDVIRQVAPPGTVLIVGGKIVGNDFCIAIETKAPIAWSRIEPELEGLLGSSGARLATAEHQIEIHVPVGAREDQDHDGPARMLG